MNLPAGDWVIDIHLVFGMSAEPSAGPCRPGPTRSSDGVTTPGRAERRARARGPIAREREAEHARATRTTRSGGAQRRSRRPPAAGSPTRDPDSRAAAEAFLSAIPADQFPHLAEVITDYFLPVGYDEDADFEFRLGLILDGRERARGAPVHWLAASSRAGTRPSDPRHLHANQAMQRQPRVSRAAMKM